jgi:hypothetical protein
LLWDTPSFWLYSVLFLASGDTALLASFFLLGLSFSVVPIAVTPCSDFSYLRTLAAVVVVG